ncbi:hypothetical protein OAD37_03600 [Gammaproteobacteria bacterium]|nr:hypothetical protein [Gammaproteobacteria bacterium]MDC1277353.1 hypothetical protein [Gammaproteobacteria bacterium]
MITSDVTYLARPSGNVIFTCADSNYFKLFGEQLISSVDKVDCFSCLHIHVINPDQEVLHLLEQYLVNFKRLTASYERVNIKLLMEVSRNAQSDWLKNIPLNILEMLAIEQVRKRNIQRKLIKIALKIGINPKFFISKKLLHSDSPRVYYACRRFSFIQDFFNTIETLIVIDIDSVCKNDSFILKLQSSNRILALRRMGSWSTYLAGFVYYPNNKEASLFIDRYTEKLTEFFENGWIFWGLDQFLLDVISTKNSTSGLHESIFGLNESDDFSFISYKGDAKYSQIQK